MAAINVIRQRVPMLDAPTLEDRTRPALGDVGRVPIRQRFAERTMSSYLGWGIADQRVGGLSRADRTPSQRQLTQDQRRRTPGQLPRMAVVVRPRSTVG
ncbi:MAG TPA: hypothetical protein VIX62_08780 [Actinomycetota bacterium]